MDTEGEARPPGCPLGPGDKDSTCLLLSPQQALSLCSCVAPCKVPELTKFGGMGSVCSWGFFQSLELVGWPCGQVGEVCVGTQSSWVQPPGGLGTRTRNAWVKEGEQR